MFRRLIDIGMTALSMLMIILFVLGMIGFVSGCTGKSQTKNDGHLRVFTPEGVLILDSKSVGYAFAESAANPAGETVTAAGHKGTEAKAAGTYKPDPIDWVGKNSKWLYIIGALVAAVGAVVGLATSYKAAGLGLTLTGFGILGAPKALESLDPFMPAIIAVAVIGIIAVVFVWWRGRQTANRNKAAAAEIKAGLQSADPQVRAGVALARAANPALNKGFEAIR